MSTPLLTTTNVATQSVYLAIPILVGMSLFAVFILDFPLIIRLLGVICRDYYRNQYGKVIGDKEQCMLVSMPRKRNEGKRVGIFFFTNVALNLFSFPPPPFFYI